MIGMAKTIAIGAALAVAALAAPARADVVSDWVELAAHVVREAPAPTAQTIHAESQVALAMFEATNTVERRYGPYLDPLPRPPRGASEPAAAAAAAHHVLTALFPDRRARFDTALAVALAQVPDGAGEEAGVALGVAAGTAVLARDGVDESIALTPYRPRATPGVWIATGMPVFAPWFATVRPWFLERADQFRPSPPPALDSERYARDFDEVRRLGPKTGSERRPDQTIGVNFWHGMDVNPAFRQVASLPGRSLAQNARFYALMSMALDDAILAMADAKLHYEFWRPITAIRNADQDGNDATTRDPAWEPWLTTPMHPEYPCGHCINAATRAAVARAEPNARVRGGLHFSDPEIPGVVTTLPGFDEYMRETSLSRIHAGVHFRFSNEAGEELGRRVGEHAVRNFMRPVR